MNYQNTFRRYEIKYLLTQEQKDAVLSAMAPHMEPDKYGRTTIRNIYLDTDSFRLIRRSIEKPVYKEKLRLRSYCLAAHDSEIFVELKKKHQSVVYKRRLKMKEDEVMQALLSDTPLPISSQIGDEIQYFREYYAGLVPKVFISYDRDAYYGVNGSGFRITFDENIMYRTEHLSLCSPHGGRSILSDDRVLMEIKAPDAIPLWLTRTLSEHGIFKTSFSKFGTAYNDMLVSSNKGAYTYA